MMTLLFINIQKKRKTHLVDELTWSRKVSGQKNNNMSNQFINGKRNSAKKKKNTVRPVC